MASNHLCAKSSKRKERSRTTGRTRTVRVKAVRKYIYVAREGKYVLAEAAEELVYREAMNMPAWAEREDGTGRDYWEASDRYERVKGTTFRELVIGLHHELELGENVALVKSFLNEIGMGHFTAELFVHFKRGEKGKNDHVHILIGERPQDGIERGGPALEFRRYNSKNPAAGGLRKMSARFFGSGNMKAIRAKWEELSNAAFAAKGLDVRISMQSLKAQGVDRLPQRHEGPGVRRAEERGERTVRGDRNRSIQTRNERVAGLKRDIERTRSRANDLRARAERVGQFETGRVGIGVTRPKISEARREANSLLRQAMLERAETDFDRAIRAAPATGAGTRYVAASGPARGRTLFEIKADGDVRFSEGVMPSSVAPLAAYAIAQSKAKGVRFTAGDESTRTAMARELARFGIEVNGSSTRLVVNQARAAALRELIPEIGLDRESGASQAAAILKREFEGVRRQLAKAGHPELEDAPKVRTLDQVLEQRARDAGYEKPATGAHSIDDVLDRKDREAGIDSQTRGSKLPVPRPWDRDRYGPEK